MRDELGRAFAEKSKQMARRQDRALRIAIASLDDVKDGDENLIGGAARSLCMSGASEDVRGLAHTVVALEGEYDLARAREVRDELYAALEEDLPVLVDLSRVEFIDTVTLGILLEAVRRSRRSRRQLVLYLPESAATQVQELFRITGFDTVLPVIRDRRTISRSR
jgi:anti-anti-sigma factor